MTTPAPPQVSARTALSRAVNQEVAHLEHAVARAGFVLATVGLVMALYTLVAVSEPLGRVLSAFAAVLMCWFTAVRVALDRGIGVRVFPWLAPLLEVSLPTALVLIDIRVEGPLYAATSAGPLQISMAMVMLSILRLNAWLPLVTGTVAALQYAAVYLWVLSPSLVTEGNAALRPDMMLMRAVVLVAGGGMATLVSRALRGAVGRAGEQWRAQDLFGKYRVLEVIAQGGMGTVHRALYCPEGGFQRPVALKRIHPHLVARQSLVDAFRSEAELSSRLTHANIVQVLDFGRVDQTYFLAMEFVDGMTLHALAKACVTARRPVAPALVAFVGRELCDGLDFAHHAARTADGRRLRVVHRDLNPPNVLLSRTGQVKITDFGIARALGDADTFTGSPAGKADYLSPEQVEERPVDERCDLFALGIILWELLCGRRLFHRSNEAATLMAIMTEPVPAPSALRTDLHPAWDAFFGRALSRELGGRFASAAQMRDALVDLAEREGRAGPEELAALMQAVAAPVTAPA